VPYVAPDAAVAFGDLFDADWLHDAFLEQDAALMAPYPLRKGAGLGYSAAYLRPGMVSDFLLAHGKRCRALLVSDDCLVETVLSRHQRGRLSFAAVFPLSDDATGRANDLATRSFGRFALPPGPHFPDGGIAELRYAFGVRVRSPQDVSTLIASRVAGLGETMRTDLEVRWNAHAARRGPLVALDTRQKLATILERKTGTATALELSAAQALGQALASCWTFEGSTEDRVSEALERGDEVHELITAVVEDLGLLRDDLDSAISQLTTVG
jgi:hypothetical protein